MNKPVPALKVESKVSYMHSYTAHCFLYSVSISLLHVLTQISAYLWKETSLNIIHGCCSMKDMVLNLDYCKLSTCLLLLIFLSFLASCIKNGVYIISSLKQ